MDNLYMETKSSSYLDLILLLNLTFWNFTKKKTKLNYIELKHEK